MRVYNMHFHPFYGWLWIKSLIFSRISCVKRKREREGGEGEGGGVGDGGRERERGREREGDLIGTLLHNFTFPFNKKTTFFTESVFSIVSMYSYYKLKQFLTVYIEVVKCVIIDFKAKFSTYGNNLYLLHLKFCL